MPRLRWSRPGRPEPLRAAARAQCQICATDCPAVPDDNPVIGLLFTCNSGRGTRPIRQYAPHLLMGSAKHGARRFLDEFPDHFSQKIPNRGLVKLNGISHRCSHFAHDNLILFSVRLKGAAFQKLMFERPSSLSSAPARPESPGTGGVHTTV